MIPSFMLIHRPLENNEDGWWGPVRENNEEPVKLFLELFVQDFFQSRVSRLGHSEIKILSLIQLTSAEERLNKLALFD